MAKAHYIVRVGNEGIAARTSDRAPNHWYYLLAQHLWGLPRGMPHVKVRAQFEADIENPRVTAYIWFLCNGYGGPGHFVQVGIGRRHLGNGPVQNGPLPIPADMMVRLQQGFDHWFDWDPVSPSAAFQDRVRGLEVPRPPYIPTLRHVTAEHPSFSDFEGMVDNIEEEAMTASRPPATPPHPTPPLPEDPPVQRDLENVIREHINPHGKGYIYLIWMSRTPFFKIGMSLDPETRLRTLQTGNPYPLHVVNVWDVGDMRSVEVSLHQRFEGKRVDNESVREWFDFGVSAGEEEAEVKKVVRDMNTVIDELK